MPVTSTKRSHMFSVYVGHLPRDITKTDLYKLFNECGEPCDIFIAEPEEHNTYNYGFVRFSNQKACVKAVQEFNQWSFHGNRIIVDFANDTKTRIKPEVDINSDSKTEECPPSANPPKAHFSDLMRLGHLQESCFGADCLFKNGADSKTQAKKFYQLLDDISKVQTAFVHPYDGQIFQDDVDLKSQMIVISENSNNNNSGVSSEFFNALQGIMSTISSIVTSEKEKAHVPDILKTEKETFNQETNCSVDILGFTTNRTHVPAAPSIASTGKESLLKIKPKLISEDDLLSVESLDDNKGVTSLNINTKNNESSSRNVIKLKTSSLLERTPSEQQQNSSSSVETSPQNILTSKIQLFNSCENLTSEQKSFTYSDSHNGDSGVEFDHVQSSLKSDMTCSSADLSAEKTPAQKIDSPASSTSSSSLENKISGIDTYLRAVTIGRGKRLNMQ